MTVFHFRSEFVFHTPVDNHTTHKQFILDSIHDEVESRRGESSSVQDTNHTISSFGTGKQLEYSQDFIQDIIKTPLDRLYQEIDLQRSVESATITSAWWNYYLPGKYTDPHTHLQSDFSGIYIVKLDETNTTRFYRHGNSGSFSLFEQYYDTGHITEGHVILFPSSLLHWVSPTQKERCSFSFSVSLQVA